MYRKCESFIGKVYKKKDLTLDEVKLNYISGFHHYMMTDEGIALNTASKYAKDLKQVMDHIVVEEDLPRNVFRTFKCTTKKGQPRYLTQEELDRLYYKKISIQRREEFPAF